MMWYAIGLANREQLLQGNGSVKMNIGIRPATATDAATIAGIYNYYVRESVITFEESDVSTTEMAGREREVIDAIFNFASESTR